MLQKDNKKELMTAYKKIRKKRTYNIEIALVYLILGGVIIFLALCGANPNISSPPVSYSSNQQRSST